MVLGPTGVLPREQQPWLRNNHHHAGVPASALHRPSWSASHLTFHCRVRRLRDKGCSVQSWRAGAHLSQSIPVGLRMGPEACGPETPARAPSRHFFLRYYDKTAYFNQTPLERGEAVSSD